MFKLLNLDRVNFLGRRLDKKMFYDNGDFSKEDKKIFIDYIDIWRKAGVNIIGGCCRTNPDIIQEVAKQIHVK